MLLQPQVIDPLLRSSMGEFLEALHDPDLNVRRVALVAFNSAAHNKPTLIRDLLHSTLPHLYSETKVRVSSHHYAAFYSSLFFNLHPHAQTLDSGSRFWSTMIKTVY